MGISDRDSRRDDDFPRVAEPLVGDPVPPVIADRYVVLGELGHGGMGRVLVPRDRRLPRDVAIKVLKLERHAPHHIHRFEQEARAAGSLNHPNIVVVHDAGSQDGEPYLVTELLEGATLREVVRDGPLEPRRAADLAPAGRARSRRGARSRRRPSRSQTGEPVPLHADQLARVHVRDEYPETDVRVLRRSARRRGIRRWSSKFMASAEGAAPRGLDTDGGRVR
jgi:Protein kinase domain